jgi:hypothetical protein
VLGGAVGDRALRHPRHDVLALDVVGDVAAVLVDHRDPVVGDLRLVDVLVTVRAVHRVEHEPGGGAVDRHPDLHLVHTAAAHAHVVGEDERVPDLPVVVLLGGTLQHPALDDPPLERREADLDVLLAERRGRGEALVAAHELEVAPVQPLDVVRVDRVLHDLDVVARQVGPADVAVAVHHVGVEARQQRRRVGPDVGPDQPAELLDLPGGGPHPVGEVGVVAFGGLVDAGALGVELPAVVGAAQPVDSTTP